MAEVVKLRKEVARSHIIIVTVNLVILGLLSQLTLVCILIVVKKPLKDQDCNSMMGP